MANWQSVVCPFHDDNANSASISPLGFICHVGCNEGKVISIPQYEELLQDAQKVKEVEIPIDEALKIFSLNEDQELRQFLKRRQIKKWVYEELQIEFDKGYIRLNNDRYPNEYSERAYIKQLQPQHRHSRSNKHIFGLTKLKQPDKRYVILVEGLYDYLTFYQLGFNVVFSGGAQVKAEMCYEISKETDHCFILFDSDYAGWQGTKKACGYFNELGFPNTPIYLPNNFGKDGNEALQKGFELELEVYIQKLVDELNTDFDVSEVKKILETKEKLLQIPAALDKVDKKLNGGYTQGLNGISGLTSSGKTSYAAYLVNMFSHLQEKKGLFCEYELTKRQIWARLLSFWTEACWSEIELCPSIIQKELNSRIVEKLSSNVRVSINPTISVIEKIAYKYDYIIIDYIQRMPRISNYDERISIKENVKRLSDLAIAQNKVIILFSSMAKADYNGQDAEYKESGDIKYMLQTSARLQKVANDVSSLRFDKNTRGEIGEVLLKMDLGHSKYFDLSEGIENAITEH